MKVGKAHAFVVEAVDMGRLENRVAVTREIAKTLVVGEDNNDMGAALHVRILAEIARGFPPRGGGGRARCQRAVRCCFYRRRRGSR